MVIKLDLMMLYKCYRHENTSKDSKEYIFENYIYMPGHFRPIPAIIQIGKITKIIKKSKKSRFFKNRYFVI